ELIVDPAAGHFLKSGLRHEQQLGIVRSLMAFEDQIDGGRMREFGAAAESSVVRIKMLANGIRQLVNQSRRPASARSGNKLCLLHGSHQSAGGFFYFVPSGGKSLGDTLEHAAKAGAAHGVLRGKVSAAVKGPAVGQQKTSERPTALAGDRTDRG